MDTILIKFHHRTPIFIGSVSVLFAHQLGLRSGIFAKYFPTKILFAYLVYLLASS